MNLLDIITFLSFLIVFFEILLIFLFDKYIDKFFLIVGIILTILGLKNCKYLLNENNIETSITISPIKITDCNEIKTIKILLCHYINIHDIEYSWKLASLIPDSYYLTNTFYDNYSDFEKYTLVLTVNKIVLHVILNDLDHIDDELITSSFNFFLSIALS